VSDSSKELEKTMNEDVKDITPETDKDKV